MSDQPWGERDEWQPSPALGHTSFHKLLTGKDDNGLVAVHDGSPESHAQMIAARKKKAGKDVTVDPV